MQILHVSDTLTFSPVLKIPDPGVSGISPQEGQLHCRLPLAGKDTTIPGCPPRSVEDRRSPPHFTMADLVEETHRIVDHSASLQETTVHRYKKWHEKF